MKSGSSRRAFTLIELLIVVAIIAVLAAIAVPNLLEAQTRAKLSRAKADMQAISTALETYGLDHNGYPHAESFFTPLPSNRFNALTTPIAYLTSTPRDSFQRRGGSTYEDSIKAFAPDEPLDVYLYNLATHQFGPGDLNTKQNRMSWSLTSGGPDQTIEFPYYAFSDKFIKSGSHILYVYDPSNGTVSHGEIFRRGGHARNPLPNYTH